MSTRRTSPVIPYRHGALAVGLSLATASAAWGADPRGLRFADEAWASLQQEASIRSSSTYELNSVVLPSLGEAPFWQTTGAVHTGSSVHSTQQIGMTRWFTPGSPESLASPDARSSFGLLLGMTAPAPSAGAAPLTAGAMVPASLDLGVRWRSRLDSGHHLDITAWARAPQWNQPQDAMGMIWQSQPPMYGTRMEVQWASSRTGGLVPEFGAVGVQLQGGSRLVLRARKGGPMLYYRAKF